jgi:uncharacterized repeat protein (TIGR01451 family)
MAVTAFLSNLTRPISFDGLMPLPDLGNPSYWDVTLTQNIYFAGAYDGWCLNATLPLSRGESGVVHLYPTYSPGSGYTAPNAALPAGFFSGSGLSAVAVIDRLDNVNWLINQQFTANPTYSWSEVQQAVWRVLGFSADQTPGATFNVQEADVQLLVSRALNEGEGFAPGPDGIFGVLMDPVYRGMGQPVLIETRFAKLGDFVWHDLNANGRQDSGENGIAGATVNLTGTDAFGAAVNLSKTTNASGFYLFDRVVPGTYTVTFSAPSGFDAVSPRQTAIGTTANDSDGLVSDPVVLTSGADNRTIDSGFYKFASLGDRVWNDLNANGIQDANEPGITGVTVNLRKCDLPAVIASTTTGADGFYQFTGLTPGEYIVEFRTPTGFAVTTANVGDGVDDSATDSDAVNLSGDGMGYGTVCIPLASGAIELKVDAGFFQVVQGARLGDRLWTDANANGVQDATEAGISGQTVTLIGGGADGLINGVNDTTATTTTGTDGIYGFTGLTPGVQYQVMFDKPAGTVFTGQDQGGDDTKDSDVDTTTGKTQIVTLTSGENNPTLDAGVYAPAALGNRVWNDTDADGQQDAGEAGVAGVTVELYRCVNNAPAGDKLATDITDDAGIYNFTGLIPGDYIVKFITPMGFTLTTANVGADGTDSDAGVGGLTGCYNLESGETDITVDAGMYRAAIDIEKLVRGEYLTGSTGGTEGLTPGFWKTHSTFGPAPLAGWPETGYNPTQSWEAVFGLVDNATVPGTPTLLDALGAGGGGVNALLRHSTAALLNAANPNVDYLYTVASIISSTKAAILSGNAATIDNLKNQYAYQNELGADLSTPAPTGTLVITPDVDADAPGSGPQIPVGGKAVFTYIVKNTGTVEISNVVVTDSRLSGLTFVGGDTDGDSKLDLTETWTYKAQEIVTSSAEIANTGTVTGTGGTVQVTDSDKAHYNGTTLTQSLGDFVWLDADRDGVQDASEAGIAGLLVTLTGGGADGLINGIGDTTTTTTTDADGFYGFNNLAAGVQYQVTFIKPAGTLFTTRDAGGNDTFDSDADTTTGKSQIVTLSAGQNNPTIDAGVVLARPGIDIEKTTNGTPNANPTAPNYDNEDTPTGAGVPILTAGTTVTWTYKVTNTGESDFAKAAIAIVDDNGTTANTADDLSIGNGITYQSGDDGDNVLEPGEAWLYKATGVVQALSGGLGSANTLNFAGSSATDGTDGNTRTYSAGGVTVDANAWSRDKNTDAWQKAWLGAYGGGLGVTDSSEDASVANTHTVDNNGRDNYIVFQFSQNVVVDKAFLGYVAGDSDLTVYVGSSAAPITSMNNAVLAGMSLKEFNDTLDGSTRWADFNAGNVQGNVLILAARDDGHSMDYFKVEQLVYQAVQSGGVYANKATVTAGGLSDSDMSHYVTTPPTPGIQIIKDAAVTTAAPNTPVTYTYAVSNTGSVALANVMVKDDNATPGYAGDDFNPAPVLNASGKNIGDLDGDNLLDLTEVWKYSATVTPPVQMNVVISGTTYYSGSLSYNTLANGDIRVTYLQSNNFNDNTYGTGSDAGWAAIGKTHTFSNLTGSDKAGFEVKATDGTVLFKFYQDYITASSTNIDGYSVYSGYQSLGYDGGDGGLVTGGTLNAQAGTLLKDFDSTLETNLNQAGFVGGTGATSWLVNSPNSNPTWNVVNGYSFVIDKAAFTAGKTFGGVTIFDQHNSPAKTGGDNSYVPTIKYGPSTNVATATATGNGTTVNATDDATVTIQPPSTKASIGNFVWEDTDKDGIQDSGEAGIAGVTVKLLNSSGDQVATRTTDANGFYGFSELTPANYKVQVSTPSGYAITLKDQGTNDAVDSDIDSTGTTIVTTLSAGENDLSWDAGFYKPVTPVGGIQIVKDASVASAAPNQPVTFTYLVTPTGGASVSNVVVKDDNATPGYAGDDFNPNPVLNTVTGKNIGDLDGNNLLDTNETWKYTATAIPAVQMSVTPTAGGTVYDSGSLSYNTLANGDIRVTYLQNNNFNDNTYGTGSNWGFKTHNFSDLTGSDKAGFEVKSANGTVLFKFYQDYISSSSTNIDGYSSYSGYQSLGISGGEGGLENGGSLNAQAATLLYDFDSTLEQSLNQSGTANNGIAYTQMTTNSPVGDANWNVINGYQFTIKASAFAGTSFGGVTIFDQHNSPAKTGGSNSYVPTIKYGPSTNVATATGKVSGADVSATDDATVTIQPPPTPASKFYVVDAGVDDVFGYAAAGASTTSFVLQPGNTDPRDIAANADASRLWVLDKDKGIYMYDGSGAIKSSWTTSSLGSEPEGLTLDPSVDPQTSKNDMWMASRDRKILWFDDAASNTTGTDVAEKTFTPSMSGDLKGIVTDGNYLWAVTEGSTDYVYRFTITRSASTGDPSTLTQSGLWKLDSANAKPTGITLDPTGGNKLWIVDEGTDMVYEYAVGRGLTSGTGVVSTSFSLGSTNVAPQGIADPLAFSSLSEAGQGAMGPFLAAKLPALADLLGDDSSLDTVLGAEYGPCMAPAASQAAAATMDDCGELARRMMEMTRHMDQSALASQI